MCVGTACVVSRNDDEDEKEKNQQEFFLGAASSCSFLCVIMEGDFGCRDIWASVGLKYRTFDPKNRKFVNNHKAKNFDTRKKKRKYCVRKG